MILQEYHKKQKEHSVTGTKPEITLLGIGMGAPESMTLEGFCACRDADCIIGAKRMLEAVKNSLAHWSVSRNCPELQNENRTDIAGMAANGACDGKTMVSMYESKQIADYIRNPSDIQPYCDRTVRRCGILQRSKETEGSIGGLSAALYLRHFQRCLFCFKAADFLG